MAWAANTLYTTPAYKEITTASTDRWSVDFPANVTLQPGESVASAVVTLRQMDPPTWTTVAGFAGAATVASGVASFDVTGAPLTRGVTYLMLTLGTLNTGKVVVLLTAVVCVA